MRRIALLLALPLAAQAHARDAASARDPLSSLTMPRASSPAPSASDLEGLPSWSATARPSGPDGTDAMQASQPPAPPPTPTQVPLDGGLAWLAIAGAGLAARTLRTP